MPNVPPSVFGRPTWTLDHQALKQVDLLPVDQITPDIEAAIYDFLWLLPSVLPCPTCANHYTEANGNVDTAWPTPTHPKPIPKNSKALAKLDPTKKSTFFQWSVWRREHVANRVGGRVYSLDECDRDWNDPGVQDECWDALTFCAFGYPFEMPADLACELPAESSRWFTVLGALLWPGLSAEQRTLWTDKTSRVESFVNQQAFLETVLWLRTTIGGDHRLTDVDSAIRWFEGKMALATETHHDESKTDAKAEIETETSAAVPSTIIASSSGVGGGAPKEAGAAAKNPLLALAATVTAAAVGSAVTSYLDHRVREEKKNSVSQPQVVATTPSPPVPQRAPRAPRAPKPRKRRQRREVKPATSRRVVTTARAPRTEVPTTNDTPVAEAEPEQPEPEATEATEATEAVEEANSPTEAPSELPTEAHAEDAVEDAPGRSRKAIVVSSTPPSRPPIVRFSNTSRMVRIPDRHSVKVASEQPSPATLTTPATSATSARTNTTTAASTNEFWSTWSKKQRRQRERERQARRVARRQQQQQCATDDGFPVMPTQHSVYGVIILVLLVLCFACLMFAALDPVVATVILLLLIIVVVFLWVWSRRRRVLTSAPASRRK